MASCAFAAAPATSPAIEEMLPLVDGAVRFLPPEGWQLVQKSEDNLRVRYTSPDQSAVIDVTVTPQDVIPQPAVKQQMAKLIKKGISEAAAKEKRELIFPVTVEK